jgi:hypothetical protein
MPALIADSMEQALLPLSTVNGTPGTTPLADTGFQLTPSSPLGECMHMLATLPASCTCAEAVEAHPISVPPTRPACSYALERAAMEAPSELTQQLAVSQMASQWRARLFPYPLLFVLLACSLLETS